MITGYRSKVGFMNIPAPHEDEMISGYLGRVAEANCATDVWELLADSGITISRYNVKADGLSYGMFDVVDIQGIEPVMQMTTLPVLVPLMSRGREARYVRSTCSKRCGNTVLSGRPASLVDHPRHCPVCDARARYTRWWHCVPGVEVCAEHGVPLVEHFKNPAGEILSHELTPGPMALEYARFVKDLGEAGPQFFMQETLPALKRKITAFESETGKHFLTHLEALGLGKAAAGLAYVIRYIEPSDNELPFEETLTALMTLYGTADAFIAGVNAESSRERFMQAIDARYYLLSVYDERIVRLRCMNCGKTFASTPHAILTGWGCPEEDADLTEGDLFARLFDTVNDGYKLISPFRDFQHKIRVEHIATGKVFEVMPDRFINFPHSGLMGKALIPDEDIRAEVEKDGSYSVGSITRGRHGIVVDVTHRPCGCMETLTLTQFRRRTGCRQCAALLAEGVIPDAADDADETMGTDMTSSSRIRADRKKDGARIRAQIALFGNAPFFLEDITVTDKRFIANTISRMARTGELRRLGSSVYCMASASPSFMDIVDAKFVLRHGERRGFHCVNTLLRDIGLVVDDPVPTVVTMTPDKAFNTDIFNLCGRQVRVIKSHIPVREDNWTALAVLFTLRHLGEAGAVDRKVLDEVLSRWMGFMGIGFADLVRFRDDFTTRVFDDAVALLRRAA